MYGWVRGSTSGLTRKLTGARAPAAAAVAARSRSSDSDSTLKQWMPAASAARISSAVLPTPENTTCPGSPPAAITRASSPPDTMSKPPPIRAKRFSTARFELAFIA